MPPTTPSPASNIWRVWSTDARRLHVWPEGERTPSPSRSTPSWTVLGTGREAEREFPQCGAVCEGLSKALRIRPPRHRLLMFEFSRFWPTDYEHGRDFIADLDTFLGRLPQLAIRRGDAEPELAQARILRMPGPAPGDACVQFLDAMPPVGEQMALPGSRTNPTSLRPVLLKPGRSMSRR